MFVIKVEFEEKKEKEFECLKEKLGLKHDTEVVRFALSHCYQEIIGGNVSAVP